MMPSLTQCKLLHSAVKFPLRPWGVTIYKCADYPFHAKRLVRKC